MVLLTGGAQSSLLPGAGRTGSRWIARMVLGDLTESQKGMSYVSQLK